MRQAELLWRRTEKQQREEGSGTRMTSVEVIDAASNTALRQVLVQYLVNITQSLHSIQGVLLRQES
jgi:hypothetical protein